MKTGKALSTFAMIGVQLLASTGLCAIAKKHRELSFNLCSKRNFAKGLNLSDIRPVESKRITRADDISRIIPRDMTPSSDGGFVATQILDHSLSNWFNSDAVKRSDWGRTAHKVEKTMESDVAFGGHEPESIKHSFKFAMRATQTKALMEYSGLTNAQLSYFVTQEKLDFEVHEDLNSLGTKVVFNHINTPDDRRDVLSLRWAW